jgi:transaldolase
VAHSGRSYERRVDAMPPQAVLDEIDREVDLARLEEVLMAEGVAKFADPHKALIELIGQKRGELTR